MEKFNLKGKAFKKMEDPNSKKSNRVKYVCYVQANSVPLEFDAWMSTNPREQKMTTNVAGKIVDSLDSNQNFHELNRGILMSVDSITYDNQSETISLTMDNPELHGNIDGGHTLRAILDAKTKSSLLDDRYVFFEFFTGLDSPVELAAARNTSVQVDLKSIAELENSFDVLKEAFSGTPFENRIAYKMNEHYNSEGVKPIDVRELLAIILMFSQVLYPYKTSSGTISETQPVQCYTGKETSLKKFLNLGKVKREEMIKVMTPIISDIFELWDKVECNFAAVSNQAGKRYGTRKYSKYNNGNIIDNAQFSGSDLQYSIPKGILYPLVGSFRALVQIEKDGSYSWVKNPTDVWNNLGGKLTSIILDEKTENPDVLGKNSNLWSNLFKEVFIYGYMS